MGLENLGPERFQQIAQALLVAEFPGVACFPVAQPDGGRDAVRVVRSVNKEPRAVVYQVKFSRNPQGVDDTCEWLTGKSEKEVLKVKTLIARGAIEYVLITNVPGTAHLDRGSIDKTLAELKAQFGIPVQCWWRDDINRRLDGHWDIKLRYPELLNWTGLFEISIGAESRP